jgi:hypothetical protein
MKRVSVLVFVVLLAVGCDIDQKKETKLPDLDVEVDVDAGQLPTFDVDWADVNVGTRTKTVSVPKEVVVMEEVEVEVPYIDVDMPNSGEKEELTLMVQAEVVDVEHRIDIQEIIASGDKLYVISKLTKMTTSLGGKKLRVSDQVVLNAPDLNVKHIIMGERPNDVFNEQYKYVKDISAFKAGLVKPRVIFTK